MPKIKTASRANMCYVRDRVAEALKPLADELGVTLTPGKVIYSKNDGLAGSVTIDLACPSADGSAQTPGEVLFKRNASLLGLKPEDFGVEFQGPRGMVFKISGLKTGRTKSPILVDCRTDGKTYKMDVMSVKTFLYASPRRTAA